MKIHFYKYQGAGNDFIITDNRLQTTAYATPTLIARLCDRRFGIGADGMMQLQNRDGFDFGMNYFNADGKPGAYAATAGAA